MAFYDAQSSLWVFPRNCSNASLIQKDYSGQPRAHLAVSIERGLVPSKQGLRYVN